MTVCARQLGSAAVACAANCDCTGTGAYDEPKCVAVQALPECAALCGCDGSVAFASESC